MWLHLGLGLVFLFGQKTRSDPKDMHSVCHSKFGFKMYWQEKIMLASTKQLMSYFQNPI